MFTMDILIISFNTIAHFFIYTIGRIDSVLIFLSLCCFSTQNSYLTISILTRGIMWMHTSQYIDLDASSEKCFVAFAMLS